MEGVRHELGAVRVQSRATAQQRRPLRRGGWRAQGEAVRGDGWRAQREAIGSVGKGREQSDFPVGEEGRGRVGEAGEGEGAGAAARLLQLVKAALE